MARAIDRVLKRDIPGFKCRKRRHHLESGPRRIDALHRLVGKGAIGVVEQCAIVRNRNTPHKQVGIIAGRGGADQNIACLAVDHHHCRALAIQPGICVGLQFVVQRQLDIRAGLSLLTVQFAHHAPGGVHLDPPCTRRAAQEVLSLRLKPNLANLKTRQA